MEVPRWVQAAFLFVIITAAAALACLGISRTGYKRLVAAKDAAIINAQTANAGLKTANADLKDDVAGLENALATLTRDRDEAHGAAAALSAEADTLRGLLDATQAKLKSLNQTRQALRDEQTESAALTDRLAKTEAARAAEAAQFAQYKTSLEETAKELQQIELRHDRGAVRRARLRERLGQLWQKLSQAPSPQAVEAGVTATAPAAAAKPGGVAAVANLGRQEVAAFERALASTGIDVKRMLSQFGSASAEGGPFVPPPKSGTPAGTVDPAKLEAIRGMAQVLPLGAPLVHYQIGSPFGTRADPFNRRAAFHTGIDMDAPYMSPVYATAPGTVVYAGYFGDYGKVVEIDHGFGIETLYAHLHRYLVSVGEHVSADAEIGLVGTTGRSTGPHVHYEVRVNGQPEDPEKFIALSRLVPIAARDVSPAVAPVTPAVGGPAENSR